MKPFDVELRSLIGKIKFYREHVYANDENRQIAMIDLCQEYARVINFPIEEVSPGVWDELNQLADDTLLKGR